MKENGKGRIYIEREMAEQIVQTLDDARYKAQQSTGTCGDLIACCAAMQWVTHLAPFLSIHRTNGRMGYRTLDRRFQTRNMERKRTRGTHWRIDTSKGGDVVNTDTIAQAHAELVAATMRELDMLAALPSTPHHQREHARAALHEQRQRVASAQAAYNQARAWHAANQPHDTMPSAVYTGQLATVKRKRGPQWSNKPDRSAR